MGSRDASSRDDDGAAALEADLDLIVAIERMLKSAPFAELVLEGFALCGRSVSNARHQSRSIMRSSTITETER